jgi:hypothetical protein
MKFSLSCNESKNILNGIMCCGAFLLPSPLLPSDVNSEESVSPLRLTIVTMGQKTSYQMGEVQPNA